MVTLLADATAPDFITPITTAFGDYGTTLLGVAGAGLAVAFVWWGFPKAVRFFKRLAG